MSPALPGALLCNGKRVILRQRVRGSVRAVRAFQNTRVFLTETRVVADAPRPFQGNIMMLNGASFFRTVKKGKLTVFKVSLYDTNKAIKAKDLKERPLDEIVPE